MSDKSLYLAITVEAPSGPPSYHLLDADGWSELDFDDASRQIRKREIPVLQSFDSITELNTHLAATGTLILEERGFSD